MDSEKIIKEISRLLGDSLKCENLEFVKTNYDIVDNSVYVDIKLTNGKHKKFLIEVREV